MRGFYQVFSRRISSLNSIIISPMLLGAGWSLPAAFLEGSLGKRVSNGRSCRAPFWTHSFFSGFRFVNVFLVSFQPVLVGRGGAHLQPGQPATCRRHQHSQGLARRPCCAGRVAGERVGLGGRLFVSYFPLQTLNVSDVVPFINFFRCSLSCNWC